jgi:hypothetical protein
MRIRTMAAVGLAVAALAGCGGGISWFGATETAPEARAAALVTQPLVDQVVSLDVAPTPSGAIVSAVGLPPTQGFWSAELVRVPTEQPATLALEFRILPPSATWPAGTQPSREVLAGTRLTEADLAGIRAITVRGARNAATMRR